MIRRLSIFNKKIMPVSESGCWLWLGVLHKTGYGIYNGKSVHRFAYVLYKGEIPNGLFVCHSCDVRSCLNPDHLFLGTNQDNMNDMKRKGRAPNNRGSNNPTSKLTEDKVRLIKYYLKKGNTCKKIAVQFSVKASTIKAISSGKNWRHVINN